MLGNQIVIKCFKKFNGIATRKIKGIDGINTRVVLLKYAAIARRRSQHMGAL